VHHHKRKLTQKNMKIDLLKASLLPFAILALLLSCHPSENTETKSSAIATENVSFEPARVESNHTFYKDGRETDVRKLEFYNSLFKTSIPLEKNTNTNNILKLTTIIVEWNKCEALVASEEAVFIQLPSNQMMGGDVETNRRNKASSIAYKIFEKEFKTLKLATTISNRDTNAVTFDFFTDKGFYTVQASKAKLEAGESIWSNLFETTKKMPSELKETMRTNEWKGK
jgi:hypothetical protein